MAADFETFCGSGGSDVNNGSLLLFDTGFSAKLFSRLLLVECAHAIAIIRQVKQLSSERRDTCRRRAIGVQVGWDGLGGKSAALLLPLPPLSLRF